jgi:ribosomal protein L32E
MMRNRRTGAAWLVSFDYRDGSYWHEPQGNLRHIRRRLRNTPNLVTAGTH